jgi:hypothetical protein
VTLWRFLRSRSRDYYGGILLIVVALAVGTRSTAYGLGTLTNMGPGLFPFAVACVLALSGLAISVGSRRGASDGHGKPLAPDLRGPLCIAAGMIAFIVLGKYGGLVPATFAVVFLSAVGDRDNSLRDAAILAAAMVGVCLVIFWWLLQIQLPLFQWGGR